MTIAPPSRQNSAGRIESLLIRGDAVAKLLAALTHEIRLMDRHLKGAGVPEDLRRQFVEQLAQQP